MNKNNKKLFLLILSLVFIDQVSKYLFYNLKYLNSNYFINCTLNKGISWGISIFHLDTLLVIIPIILGILIYLYQKKQIGFYTFLFIFSGGLGNYIDRIFYGGVRDFIDLHFFPIFNVADIFVSIGALLLILSIIKQHQIK